MRQGHLKLVLEKLSWEAHVLLAKSDREYFYNDTFSRCGYKFKHEKLQFLVHPIQIQAYPTYQSKTASQASQQSHKSNNNMEKYIKYS